MYTRTQNKPNDMLTLSTWYNITKTTEHVTFYITGKTPSNH